MTGPQNAQRFEDLVLPHLDAAYNFARWIVKNDAAAQDILQEAALSALKGFHRFSGGSARAWLLTIVRHESYDWLSRTKAAAAVSLDDDDGLSEEDTAATAHHETPERALERLQDRQAVNAALNELPGRFREVLVLKELEDMSYKDIALVTGVPIGTVMSRLSRGRALLKQILAGRVHASKS